MSFEHRSRNPFSPNAPLPRTGTTRIAREVLGRGGERVAKAIRTRKDIRVHPDEKEGVLSMTDDERAEFRERSLQPGEFFLEGVTDLPSIPGYEDLANPSLYDLDRVFEPWKNMPTKDKMSWYMHYFTYGSFRFEDPDFPRRFLSQLEEKKEKPIARILSLTDLLTEWMDEYDPALSGEATTSLGYDRALVAIERAGYRPSDYSELLAFARYHWRPKYTDRLDARRKKLGFGVHEVVGLGSIYFDPGLMRVAPALQCSADFTKRALYAVRVSEPINDYMNFLVVKL